MTTLKTITILLLVVAVAGCQVTWLPSNDPEDVSRIEAEKNEEAVLERIRTMKIVQEESLLIRDILLLKAEITKIQAAGDSPNPPQRPNRQPVNIPELGVEGEFIPLDELPADMK